MSMDLFGKRKEVVAKDIEEIKRAVDTRLPTREDLERSMAAESGAGPQAEEHIVRQNPKPAAAPIFIKLDRYNTILSSMSEIRKGLEAIKNVFSYVSELEKMKSESFRMLHDMVAKIDKKLAYLDSEFLRPPGFEETPPEVALGPDNLESIIDNMKGKIDELRSQIEGI